MVGWLGIYMYQIVYQYFTNVNPARRRLREMRALSAGIGRFGARARYAWYLTVHREFGSKRTAQLFSRISP